MHSLLGRREDIPPSFLFYKCQKIILIFNFKLQLISPLLKLSGPIPCHVLRDRWELRLAVHLMSFKSKSPPGLATGARQEPALSEVEGTGTHSLSNTKSLETSLGMIAAGPQTAR
jgi:hypothetical protein